MQKVLIVSTIYKAARIRVGALNAEPNSCTSHAVYCMQHIFQGDWANGRIEINDIKNNAHNVSLHHFTHFRIDDAPESFYATTTCQSANGAFGDTMRIFWANFFFITHCVVASLT